MENQKITQTGQQLLKISNLIDDWSVKNMNHHVTHVTLEKKELKKHTTKI